MCQATLFTRKPAAFAQPGERSRFWKKVVSPARSARGEYSEIRLRAERRAGELLSKVPKNKGAQIVAQITGCPALPVMNLLSRLAHTRPAPERQQGRPEPQHPPSRGVVLVPLARTHRNPFRHYSGRG
jgi:hypothetical protein